jgi:hypothetical protein
VPRVLEADDAGPLRECSPPPRRCSYASTLSENSSISLNTSYQSLLFSPLICPDQGQCCAAAQRSRWMNGRRAKYFKSISNWTDPALIVRKGRRTHHQPQMKLNSFMPNSNCANWVVVAKGIIMD